MFTKIIFLTIICLAAVVRSNDLRLGHATAQSRKIFGEIKEADPALWKRTDDVVIDTVGSEVISAIYITDLRDDKNGEAYIESGGIGQKSVTVGLKSPTILRGYKFQVDVYADDGNQRYYSNDGNQRYNTKGGAAQYNYDDTQYSRKF